MSRFEFERIDLAVTSLMANRPVASEPEHACDQCQRVAVTPPVNLEFFIPISRLQIDFIAIDS